MLETLKKTFSNDKSASSGADSHIGNDADTPRYPPFMKGLPAQSATHIMGTQKKLISRLREAVGTTDEEFDRLYVPMIRSYAEYVHLLPASESHHHRGAGGLFRHGLEVSLWAVQGADRIMFGNNEFPKERREIEPVWRCGVFVSALCHDIGKPLSDLQVHDMNGKVSWSPQGESLDHWLTRKKLDRYYINWRQRRHMRHESLTPFILPRFVPETTMHYLERGGPELYERMLSAVSARDFQTQSQEHNPIFKLVREADAHSTQKDVSDPLTAGLPGALGVPLERYFMDAMRRLALNKWKINRPGARLWYIDGSAYLTWPAASKDVTHDLGQQKAPGIPQHPDSIAEVLIDRGLAVPYEEEGGHSALWPIKPDVLKDRVAYIMALRIDSETNLLSEPPASVDGLVGIEAVEGESQNDNDAEQDDAEGETPDTDSDTAEPRASTDETTESSKTSENQSNTVNNGSHQKTKKSKANNQEDAQASLKWFHQNGHPGIILAALAEDVRDGELEWRRHVVKTSTKRIAIRHPEGWAGSGVEAKSIVPMMDEQAWVEVEKFNPMKKILNIKGFDRVKGNSEQPAVVLSQEPSAHFLTIAKSQKSQQDQARDSQSDEPAPPKTDNTKAPGTTTKDPTSEPKVNGKQQRGDATAPVGMPEKKATNSNKVKQTQANQEGNTEQSETESTQTENGLSVNEITNAIYMALDNPENKILSRQEGNWLYVRLRDVANIMKASFDMSFAQARVELSNHFNTEEENEIKVPLPPDRKQG